MTDDATITLINLFNVPQGKLEETMEMWTLARDFMLAQPGFVSAQLHRSHSSNARYQLVNVAKWESKDACLEAMTRMRSEVELPIIEGLESSPALYDAVHL